MHKKAFESLLYNIKNKKSELKEFMTNVVKSDFNIDIYQLRLIVACFEYNTQTRKTLHEKIDFFNKNTIIANVEKLSTEQLLKHINQKPNINQMNQIIKCVRNIEKI